jgi:hypothetical protein
VFLFYTARRDRAVDTQPDPEQLRDRLR